MAKCPTCGQERPEKDLKYVATAFEQARIACVKVGIEGYELSTEPDPNRTWTDLPFIVFQNQADAKRFHDYCEATIPTPWKQADGQMTWTVREGDIVDDEVGVQTRILETNPCRVNLSFGTW